MIGVKGREKEVMGDGWLREKGRKTKGQKWRGRKRKGRKGEG